MTASQIAYVWIQGIIDSSNNDFHFDGVDKLIHLFNERYNNASLTICLQQQRQDHWNNLHSILN